MLSKEAIFQKVANREITREEALQLLRAQIALAKTKATEARQPSPVTRVREPDQAARILPTRFAISELQKALWFFHQIAPDDYAYNIPLAFKLKGRVDKETVRQTVAFLVKRHRGLRATFETCDTSILQVIHDHPNHEFQIVDASHWPENKLIQTLHDFGKEPFDLEKGPLFKARIYDRGDQPPALMMVVHHIIFDGTSSGNIINEFHQIYTSLDQATEPKLQPIQADYSDFVQWQKDYLAGPDGQNALNFWKERLAGELPILELPVDHTRSGVNQGQVLEVKIDPEIIIELKAWSRKKGVSLFTTLLTVTKILLYRYTHQTDLIVGTPVVGRPERRFRSMLGYFINMVSLRTQLDPSKSLTQTVNDVQDTVLHALDHADYPFPNLVRALGIEIDTMQPPVFQVCFILQSWSKAINLGAFDAKPDGSLYLEAISDVHETGGYDLTLEILEVEDYATAHFKYNSQLFEKDRMVRMSHHFQNLLRTIISEPECSVNEIQFLDDKEREDLLAQMRGPRAKGTPAATIHELISAQVTKTPDADAVIFADDRLSYRQLEERSNQLGHLLRSKGVGPESMVAVCLERGLDMIVSLLAVLKAGGCYVPMDPAYPQDRMTAILNDTGSPVMLTQTSLLENIPKHAGHNLCIDQVWSSAKPLPTSALPQLALAENPAYTIFTSGSTGKPKGVLIPHRALVNYCHHFVAHYHLTSEDRMLQFASISFDTAAEEIYPTLISGGTLVLRKSEDSHTMRGFLQLLQRQQITLLDLPTAYWHEMVADMEDGDSQLPESIRLVIVGGEAASLDRLETWRRIIGNRIVWSNTYGPTEATIVATLFEPDFQSIEAS